jgi:hypothetical protein
MLCDDLICKNCKCTKHSLSIAEVKCQTRQIEHIVLIHEIARDKNAWGVFLKVKKFHAGVKKEDKDKGIRGFGDLKEEL